MLWKKQRNDMIRNEESTKWIRVLRERNL